MSSKNKKRLSIATIVLGAMFPISLLATELISEAFLFVGIYCGISAMLCGMILVEVKKGKRPPYVPVIVLMIFFGACFRDVPESYPAVGIALSNLYIGIGSLLGIQRIDAWLNRRSSGSKQAKKRTDLGREINPVAGSNVSPAKPATVCCVRCRKDMTQYMEKWIYEINGKKYCYQCREELKRQNANSNTSHSSSGAIAPTPKTAILRCDSCGLDMTCFSSAWVYKAYGRTLCLQCKENYDRENKKNHNLCSACGVDLPIAYMHDLNGALICHDCFLKKCDNIYFSAERATGLAVEEAIEILRAQIIEELTKNPSEEYELATLTGKDVADCFPENDTPWDSVKFNLNLLTGKLSADLQAGQCCGNPQRQSSRSMTAFEFYLIAWQYGMDRSLQAFVAEEDWARLLNDDLKTAIASSYERF